MKYDPVNLVTIEQASFALAICNALRDEKWIKFLSEKMDESAFYQKISIAFYMIIIVWKMYKLLSNNRTNRSRPQDISYRESRAESPTSIEENKKTPDLSNQLKQLEKKHGQLVTRLKK